ncbi:MAG: hypothetical protein WEC83_00160 [Patescibacteria group bacterium]
MPKTSRRKLFLFGRYSLALLPPKKWLSQLGVKAGDEAVVELDQARRRLVVRFDQLQQQPNAKPAKKPTPPADGWEDIPQL